MKNYPTIEKLQSFKGLNGFVYPYIVEKIEFEGTIKEKLEFLADTFFVEKVKFDKSKNSYQNLLKDFFQGVPSSINIDYLNDEILKIAVSWGSIPENATEKQKEKITQNWYNFLAIKTMQLFNKYNVKIKK